MKTKNNLIQLKTWLLNKPLFFALSFFISGTILFLIYAAIMTIFNPNDISSTGMPAYILFLVSFIACTWYTIKKLPHEIMNQNDFVAITNGASIISILTSLVTFISIGFYGEGLRQDVMILYMQHPLLFIALFLLLILLALYLIGVAICGIYAKYKRANTIGISPWKIILSMPFGFLLTWTPGYLIKEKNIKNNMEIKSRWYARFNKWVMSNFSNTLFVFLFLLLFKGVIAGMPTFVLYLALLTIYALWYVKHKSDFIKNINRGYALTAVVINVTVIIMIIYSLFSLGGHPY